MRKVEFWDMAASLKSRSGLLVLGWNNKCLQLRKMISSCEYKEPPF